MQFPETPGDKPTPAEDVTPRKRSAEELPAGFARARTTGRSLAFEDSATREKVFSGNWYPHTASVQEASAVDRRIAVAVERERRSLATLRLVTGIVLIVCFWFAVPYRYTAQHIDDLHAAATEIAQNFEGSLSREIALPVVVLLSLYLLRRMPLRAASLSPLAWLVLAYGTWATASVFWAEDAFLSMKRLVVFLMCGFFCFAAARLYSIEQLAFLGFAQSAFIAVISLCVDIAKGVFYPLDPDYRFQGVQTANFQAIHLLVLVACGLLLMDRRIERRRWVLPSLVVAMVLLVLTRARVETVLCLGILAAWGYRAAMRRLHPAARALLLVAAFALAIPASIIVLGSENGGATVETVLMMGRPDAAATSSLSNRAPLWETLGESLSQHPWLGFGFDGFWTPARVEHLSEQLAFRVPNAHNTLLDQALSLGLIGAVLYILVLGIACVLAWSAYRRQRTPDALFSALLISWLILTGFSESVPVSPQFPLLVAFILIAKLAIRDGVETRSTAPLTLPWNPTSKTRQAV